MSGDQRTLDIRRLALGTMVLEKTKEVFNVAVEAREVRDLVTREEWSSKRSMELPDLAVRLQERTPFGRRRQSQGPRCSNEWRRLTLKIPLPKKDQRAVRQVGPLSKLAKSDERMVLTLEGSVVKMMSRPRSLRL